MKPLRFAPIGAGFWARYQLAGWREVGGAECVAVYNRTQGKAEALARAFGIPAVYDDAAAMLREQRPDFADIVSGVETHRAFGEMAAARSIPVVCQTPMAPSMEDAEAMEAACHVRTGGAS